MSATTVDRAVPDDHPNAERVRLHRAVDEVHEPNPKSPDEGRKPDHHRRPTPATALGPTRRGDRKRLPVGCGKAGVYRKTVHCFISLAKSGEHGKTG